MHVDLYMQGRRNVSGNCVQVGRSCTLRILRYDKYGISVKVCDIAVLPRRHIYWNFAIVFFSTKKEDSWQSPICVTPTKDELRVPRCCATVLPKNFQPLGTFLQNHTDILIPHTYILLYFFRQKCK
jgi:hypothetical protein